MNIEKIKESFDAFVDNLVDDGELTPGNLAGLVLSLLSDAEESLAVEDQERNLEAGVADVIDALLNAEPG